MQAGGYQEVARALGRGLGQDRGFDLHKLLPIHVVAQGLQDLVAHAQRALHARPADVEVAVLHAHRLALVRVVVVDVDGRGFRLVEQDRLAHKDLDAAGLELFVHGRLVAQGNLALHGEHVLAAQALAQGEGLLVAVLFVKDELDKARAVPEPDKDDGPEVAGALHPTGEVDQLPGVGLVQLRTHVRSAKADVVHGNSPFIAQKTGKKINLRPLASP